MGIGNAKVHLREMNKGMEKKDYCIPTNGGFREMCYCMADCKNPCARKNLPTDCFFTATDYTYCCTSFKS